MKRPLRSRILSAALLPLAVALAAAPAAGQAEPGPAVDGGAAAAATVMVAARDLARGETLAAADIVRAERPAGFRGEQPAVLEGWTTRRVIAAGEALLPPAVAAPELVKAGEEVEMVLRSGTVQLTVRGTAAGSAALGERVLVRVDARRRLEGVVIGPALVELKSSDRGR